jgi:ABC-2 type transport system ATP-binding protein
MRQKVLISAALLHDPEIVVLDEPCSGLDVSTTMVLREVIHRLSAAGKIVVYSSHVMDMVEKVSSRVLIVHRSRVVADNSVGALRELLALPSLEAVFAELTVEEDVAATAEALVATMQA